MLVSQTLVLLVSVVVSSSSLGAITSNSAALDRQPNASAVTQAAPPLVSPTPRKNLFGKLFVPMTRQPASPSSLQRPAGSVTPKVVCGMVLIPGDSTIDPHMAIEIPKSETKFTIRAIQPSLCWPK